MREYFYTIDREGNLYHDETLLTDEKFLNFFFKRVKANDTGVHPDYGYVSPCGKEMNYISCEDTPLVFSSLEEDRLYYAPRLSVEFTPTALVVRPNGVLYHPAPAGEFGRIGSRLILSWYDYLQPGAGGETVLHLPGFEPAIIRSV